MNKVRVQLQFIYTQFCVTECEREYSISNQFSKRI